MLFQIAWRNVLRNKKRSSIIISAIACGLWAGLVASSVSLGFSDATVESALKTRLSDIQVHQKAFRESHAVRDTIPGAMILIERISQLHGVRAVSGRLLAEGMASTAETSAGVLISGVDSDREKRVTTIADRLIQGTYAVGKKRNVVIIGQELAVKLSARLGSKIILTSQDARCASEIRSLAPGLTTETWMDIAPDLRYINEYTEVYLNIFLYVIVLALLFGIVNTMLMSVMDRVRELGVLTAIGMKGRRIFTMIMLESVILSSLGAIAGMIAGWGTVEYLKRTGINLASFGEGLRQWGYADISYPVLSASMFEQVIVSIVAAAIIGAAYPAWKAIRLDPARAIQTY